MVIKSGVRNDDGLVFESTLKAVANRRLRMLCRAREWRLEKIKNGDEIYDI
jgi:hypothetical protein